MERGRASLGSSAKVRDKGRPYSGSLPLPLPLPATPNPWGRHAHVSPSSCPYPDPTPNAETLPHTIIQLEAVNIQVVHTEDRDSILIRNMG